MGILHYGVRDFVLDDRVLAHLQALISVKLRRGENFFVSWEIPSADGSGRMAVWIDNGVPIACEFSGSKLPAIHREWLDQMAESSASALGLHISGTGEFTPAA
jgi:hypothetical protein